MTAPNSPASNAPAAASPTKGSSTRMIVLLGILVVVTAVTAYDYMVAAPATEEANKKLERFVIQRNEQGIQRPAEGDDDASKRADQFVRSDDVQELLGRSPSLVRKFENNQGGHMVEYYFFRPWLPVPEMGKHYVAVVYWGLKNPRYMSHHMNTVPPPDTAPDYREPERPATGAPAPTGGVDPGTMPGAGGMKGKSPSAEKSPDTKGSDSKTEDKPADETPAVEKPAETPAEPEKPAGEKPAEDKPAEDKPAEKPAEASP